jgi:hypothetical protein
MQAMLQTLRVGGGMPVSAERFVAMIMLEWCGEGGRS